MWKKEREERRSQAGGGGKRERLEGVEMGEYCFIQVVFCIGRGRERERGADRETKCVKRNKAHE